jgi:predicted RNase H-like nuclease
MPTSLDSPLVAVGADGARGGWATACLYADATSRANATVWETRLELLDTITDLAAFRDAAGASAAVAIDVPIGLHDTVAFRACDEQARELLKSRASAVFMPPARYMLAAGGNYAAIRALVKHEQATNPAARGISAQAAGLVPKVAEVDTWVRAHPNSEQWLWECHPELSFRTLNDGAPLAFDKRSPAGVMRRMDLLRDEFPDLDLRLADAPWPGSRIDITDALDAYAALSTALECAREEQEELGDGQRDSAGVLMRMTL